MATETQLSEEFESSKKQKTSEDQDYIEILRELCFQNDYPLPSFEFVKRQGQFSPEFNVRCSIGTIVRYASGITKSVSKQNVAQELIEIINSVSKFLF